MEDIWSSYVLQTFLNVALVISTALTIIIITLPTQYDPTIANEVTEEAFNLEDKKDAQRSGYSIFQDRKNAGTLEVECSVQVIVLGDIGRSPRMQYHALSIASLGGKVNVVGYAESEMHPDLQASRFATVTAIRPFPQTFQTNSKILFLLLAPLKVVWQTFFLYHAICYRSAPAKWMIVQNPPSIPTLLVAQICCFFRKTKLVIDWHNFGYTILALRLGARHPLVRIAEWFEGTSSSRADAHFAVTHAMSKVLKKKWSLEALVLHDRPPKHFQPLTIEQKAAFLHQLPETAIYATHILDRKWRLIVSSTSWTADEDFSVLLDALVEYSSTIRAGAALPRILAIITGKGPQKEFYLSRIRQLNQENKLAHVVVTTAWLSSENYASLLGSADLGVSLHTSSSGVDLPMKVVDMFGTGLPVAGWSKFEAWPELVQEGYTGRGFESAESLNQILEDLFAGTGMKLDRLREGALRECARRWDDEWMPVAGRLLQLKPK